MNNEEAKEIREKIIKGLDLAFERLLVETLKEDGELVFSKDGKIVKIKASELMKEKNKIRKS